MLASKKIIRDVHSTLTVRTQRSAKPFRFGLSVGNGPTEVGKDLRRRQIAATNSAGSIRPRLSSRARISAVADCDLSKCCAAALTMSGPLPSRCSIGPWRIVDRTSFCNNGHSEVRRMCERSRFHAAMRPAAEHVTPFRLLVAAMVFGLAGVAMARDLVPVLRPGDVLEGVVEESDPVVRTDAVAGGETKPVRRKTYRVELTEAGSYFVELRSNHEELSSNPAGRRSPIALLQRMSSRTSTPCAARSSTCSSATASRTPARDSPRPGERSFWTARPSRSNLRHGHVVLPSSAVGYAAELQRARHRWPLTILTAAGVDVDKEAEDVKTSRTVSRSDAIPARMARVSVTLPSFKAGCG